MVITKHWIDSHWKRVLNFEHVPPPRQDIQIVDAIFKCLKDWGIENKGLYSLIG